MFTNLSLSTHKILTPSFQHKKTNNQHSFVGFFSGELTQLRIRILRSPGIETLVKTVAATQPGSALLSFAVARFGIADETVVASRCVSASYVLW